MSKYGPPILMLIGAALLLAPGSSGGDSPPTPDPVTEMHIAERATLIARLRDEAEREFKSDAEEESWWNNQVDADRTRDSEAFRVARAQAVNAGKVNSDERRVALSDLADSLEISQ